MKQYIFVFFLSGCAVLPTLNSDPDIAQQIWGNDYDVKTVEVMKNDALNGMPDALVALLNQLKRTEMQYCIQSSQDIQAAMAQGYCKPLSPAQIDTFIPYWDTRYALIIDKGLFGPNIDEYYGAELYKVNGKNASLIKEFPQGKDFALNIQGDTLLISYSSPDNSKKKTYKRRY